MFFVVVSTENKMFKRGEKKCIVSKFVCTICITDYYVEQLSWLTQKCFTIFSNDSYV